MFILTLFYQIIINCISSNQINSKKIVNSSFISSHQLQVSTAFGDQLQLANKFVHNVQTFVLVLAKYQHTWTVFSTFQKVSLKNYAVFVVQNPQPLKHSITHLPFITLQYLMSLLVLIDLRLLLVLDREDPVHRPAVKSSFINCPVRKRVLSLAVDLTVF